MAFHYAAEDLGEDMHRPEFMPIAALALSLLACAQQNRQPSTGSPQDLAYCAELSRLYQRYVGADPVSPSMAGITPDVAGGEAMAKCHEGDARASIPTLERLLTNAGMTLPPRP